MASTRANTYLYCNNQWDVDFPRLSGHSGAHLAISLGLLVPTASQDAAGTLAAGGQE